MFRLASVGIIALVFSNRRLISAKSFSVSCPALSLLITAKERKRERDRRLAWKQWEARRGGMRQRKTEPTPTRIDKEPGWPPVCLSLVLLLAPSLSATGRISLSYPQHSSPAPPTLTLVSPPDRPVSDVSCLWESTQTCALSHMNGSCEVGSTSLK